MLWRSRRSVCQWISKIFQGCSSHFTLVRSCKHSHDEAQVSFVVRELDVRAIGSNACLLAGKEAYHLERLKVGRWEDVGSDHISSRHLRAVWSQEGVLLPADMLPLDTIGLPWAACSVRYCTYGHPFQWELHCCCLRKEKVEQIPGQERCANIKVDSHASCI